MNTDGISGVSMQIVGIDEDASAAPSFLTSIAMTGENRDLLTFYITCHRVSRAELAELFHIAYQALTHENRLEVGTTHDSNGGCTHDQH